MQPPPPAPPAGEPWGQAPAAAAWRPPPAAPASHTTNAATNKLHLSAWQLPRPIVDAWQAKGLQQLYPWQAAALECGAGGSNLVYCAPTSGGKSLVAEVLMLARLHRTQQALEAAAARQQQHMRGRPPQQQPVTRALMVLPYLSIVSEKAAHLGRLLEPVRWRVRGYVGSEDGGGQPLAHPAERVAICSIEKANGAVNRLIQEQRLAELVAVVVDEAHMLADPHRGAVLEMLLAKLVACRASCRVQIIAMSATMAGLDSLSEWLGARLFLTNFRPVPLSEHAVFGGTVFAKQPASATSAATEGILTEQRTLPGSEKDSLVTLVAEVAAEGHSALVFCAGRSACQSCASLLAKRLSKLLGPPNAAAAAARADLVERLRIALAGCSEPAFEALLAAGVAYHHAGLTHQERAIVEEGFTSGALLVLTATSTLAAGVNLPARRVVLRSLWQGTGNVSRAQYLQMVGRAGRAGHSAVGESFLLGAGAAHSPGGQWGAICALLAARLPVLQSQLVAPAQPEAAAPAAASARFSRPAAGGIDASADTAGTQLLAASAATASTAAATATQQQQQQKAQVADLYAQPLLQHLLLDAVATGLVGSGQTVLQLLQSTLAFHQLPWAQLEEAAKGALSALRARRLVSLQPASAAAPSHWQLTPLGAAVVASALPPDTGLLLHGRLSGLLECVVLGCNAHLLYILQLSGPLVAILDWAVWHQLLKDLSPQQQRVAQAEAIEQEYVHQRMAGRAGDPSSDAKHGRLAGAVLLDRLLCGASSVQALEAVWGQPNGLTKAGITRGMMQRWQQELAKTAAMAALLASSTGWWQLEMLLGPLAAQAAAGVRPQLLPLMQVAGMQPAQAAALHAAGLGHPDLLLSASESDIAAALAAGLPPNLRKRKPAADDTRGLAVGLTGSAGTNAMVARAARMLLAAARQHAVSSAAEEAEEAAAAAAVATGADGAEDGTSQGQPPPPQQQQQLVPRVQVLTGQALVHQVWPDSRDPLLSRVLDAWQLQSSFSMAVLLHSTRCASSSGRCSCEAAAGSSSSGGAGEAGGAPCRMLHAPVAAGLLLCWADKEAVLLHLPSAQRDPASQDCTAAAAAGGAAAGGSAPASDTQQQRLRVLQVVHSLLGDAGRTVTMLGAERALAALAAAGIECRAAVDDPAAAFLLWQPCGMESFDAQQQQQQPKQGHGGQDDAARSSSDGGGGSTAGASVARVSRAAASVVLGSAFRLQVPPLPASSCSHGADTAAAAARCALLARALMPPLRAVLAKQQLAAVYERVERPLLHALADVRGCGAHVDARGLQQLQQAAGGWLGMLQQQLSQALGGVQLDARDDEAVRELVSRMQLLSMGAERARQQPLPALLLAALRGALRRQQWRQVPLLRLLLSHARVAAFDAGLAQLLRYAVTEQQQVLVVPLQPLPGLAEVSGELHDGWPSSLAPLQSLPVPALPVLIRHASLAQQGISALSASVAVAAAGVWAPPPHQQPSVSSQQQQQPSGPSQYYVGSLCSLAQLPAATSRALSDNQQMPWVQQQQADQQHEQQQQQPSGQGAGSSSLSTTEAQPPGGATGAAACIGTVRQWCSISGCVLEQQVPAGFMHTVQLLPDQQQQQQGGTSTAFLPGCLSIRHLMQPASCAPGGTTDASSSSSSFVGVSLECLSLLVVAGLSAEPSLLRALQARDPLAAAADAWLQAPTHGLPRHLMAQMLGCVEAGALDGQPVPPARAPRLLFAHALRSLVLGQQPAMQRDALGLTEWSKGTSLADSLCDAFPGLGDWRAALMERTRKSGHLTTCLGRRLPVRLPPLPRAGASLSKAAAKQLKQAERAAASLALLASSGDLERLVVAALQRCCKAWQQQQQQQLSGVAAGAAGSGGRVLQPTQQKQKQDGVGGSSKPACKRRQSVAQHAPDQQQAAAAPQQPQQQHHHRQWRFVAVGRQQVVLQVPSGWALPLLAACVQQVHEEVWRALQQQQLGPDSGGGGGSGDGSHQPSLPFRWWWGSSLDVCCAQQFTPSPAG